MKQSEQLRIATEARDAARARLRNTSTRLRARLAPRALAADAADVIAARAGRIFLRRGITRNRRIAAACSAVAAVATAIVLRAALRNAAKKTGDLSGE